MIKAIETAYDGRLFRSRAEARWAAFFKALGLAYEYEPEGVQLDDGRRYLPDFRLSLKHHGAASMLWAEVKPHEWNNDGKLEGLAMVIPSADRATLLPSLESYLAILRDQRDELVCWFGGGGCDYGFMFCVCPDCRSVGFEHGGRAARMSCCTQPSNAGRHEDKNYQHANGYVVDAMQRALSERFGT